MVEYEYLIAGGPLGQFAIGIGLSWLAGLLLDGDKDRTDNDKPTTLSKRGSYVSWFLGVRRVAPVFCAAHGRYSRKERAKSGGKGSALAPKVEVFYESGWHALAVGPVDALHKILQSGKVIFDGPITPASHPSGSLIEAGDEGEFRIYWGDSGQPVDAELAVHTGISSTYPNLCYVHWIAKRLGQSPTWPVLDYELERRPNNTELTGTSWVDPSLTLTGPTFSVTDVNANADADTGYLQIEKDFTGFFKPTTQIFITGNTLAAGAYEVRRSEAAIITAGTRFDGTPWYKTVTRVYLEGGTLGADANGTMQTYESDGRAGLNIANGVADLLFEPWPQGLGLDPNDTTEAWDLVALQAMHDEADTEGWVSSLYAQNGEKASGLITGAMQDTGHVLRLEQQNGRWAFTPVREPSGTVANLGSDIWSGKLPEITTVHAEPNADRLVFKFKDRAYEYGDMTIAVDDDGASSYAEYQKSRSVPIVTTTDFQTAAALSELRAPEELSNASEIKLSLAKGARGLQPGDAVTAHDFPYVLRVLEVEIDPDSEEVSLTVVPDFYGVAPSDVRVASGGGQVSVNPMENEEQFSFLEVPEQLLGGLGSTQTLLPVHIRATDQTSQVGHWLSRDNSTYEFDTYDTFFQAGGTLDAELAADTADYVAQSVTFTEAGPDNSTLTQDLSADDTNFYAGRQVAFIVSSNGVEICFLRKATVTVPGTRRLDGLLRGRYDTRKISHPAGAEIYIFDADVAQPIQDILLQPELALYLKSQSVTMAGTVDISAVAAYGQALYGKGVRPIQPDGFSVSAPLLNTYAYSAGSDLVIKPLLSSGTVVTGAGGQAAGASSAGSVLPGTVTVQAASGASFTVTADAQDGSVTIPSATLAAAGNPASFTLTVTHNANGYSSQASAPITITKL